MIRLSPIRLIDQDGKQVGVVETADAQKMAREAGLDLVEVQPDVRPPVCKITDYGKYKYELSKKESKGKATAKQQELKEVRLGRSIKVDPHDIGIRVNRARKFLLQGHKVLLVQQFRGREMMHRKLGVEIIESVVEALEGLGKPDGYPRVAGRRMTLLLNPDRVKVEAANRKLANARAKAEAQKTADAALAVDEQAGAMEETRAPDAPEVPDAKAAQTPAVEDQTPQAPAEPTVDESPEPAEATASAE